MMSQQKGRVSIRRKPSSVSPNRFRALDLGVGRGPAGRRGASTPGEAPGLRSGMSAEPQAFISGQRQAEGE